MNKPNTTDSKPNTTETIELSISPEYINWNMWECVREFIQNCIDEDTKDNIGLITYDVHNGNKHGGTLTLTNAYASLRRHTLLLGSTDKRNDDSQLGCYGEGYKLAIAGLLHEQSKYEIEIHTGFEKWTPAIEYSERFGNQIVVIRIENTEPKGHFNGTKVVIKGIDKYEWQLIKQRTLRAAPTDTEIENSYDIVTVERGYWTDLGVNWSTDDIKCPVLDENYNNSGHILSEAYAGQLFCNGLYVGKLRKLVDDKPWKYGYNLNNISLDRDRKMSSRGEITANIQRLFIETGRSMNTLFSYDEYMKDSYADIEHLFAPRYSTEFKTQMQGYVDKFNEENPNSFPCDSCDIDDIESVGLGAVVMDWGKAIQFHRVLGRVSDIVMARRNAYVKVDTSDYKDTIRQAEILLTELFELDSFCILPVAFDGKNVDSIRDYDEGTELNVTVLVSAKHDTFKALVVHSIKAYASFPYETLAALVINTEFCPKVTS